ncbi:Por secretion system C-terminal sorting domain-containing protein [Saccharicrinis carchari]|uniref:Por secretion system C-terminal sorting domain-containing protein n=1 Tax=Saccharicrinis carchari TaxID=1168039 RepID=A0A521F564_SACCC|nr:M4 family metallopeptidase [Saccharicrinis carchari]SMO91294.1 Por secretion system C-terminal sorting domain-containing protein [Saccharicrinis carchari]
MKDGQIKHCSSRIPEDIIFYGKDNKVNTKNIKEIAKSDSILSSDLTYIQDSLIKNLFILVQEVAIIRDGLEYVIHIDAENGDLLHEVLNSKRFTISTDTFETLYNGFQTAYFKTEKTHNIFGSSNTWWNYLYGQVGAGTLYAGDLNMWYKEDDSPSQNSHFMTKIVGSAYWAGQRAYLYFKNILSAPNINWSVVLRANTDYDLPSDEVALYNPTSNRIIYSRDKPFCRDAASVDIIGHEYGHHISDQYTNGLSDPSSYHDESGALLEGISDIFARAIQYNVEGYNEHRIETMGEDVIKNDPKLMRSFRDPNSLGFHFEGSSSTPLNGQPDTYEGLYFFRGYANNGGVHVNNGVINHWMYLLSMGGSGNNDHGTYYNVNGIGIDKGAKIVFNALPFLLFESQFSDFRNATIIAAENIYGLGSNESKQVANAWNAVGVPGNEITATITGPTLICEPGTYTYNINNLPAVDSIIWEKGVGLVLVSGQNTSSCTFNVLSHNGFFLHGSTHVTATIVYKSGHSIELRHDLWMGFPSAPDWMRYFNSNGMEFGSNQYYSFVATSSTAFENISYDWDWEVSGGTILNGQGTNSLTVKTATATDTKIPFTVKVRIGNLCGWGSYFTRTGYVLPVFLHPESIPTIAISPNPTVGETTLSIESVSEEKSFDEAIVWDMEIYGTNQLLKTKKTSLRGKSTKIYTSGWQEGVYIVRVTYKIQGSPEKVITGKIVVKR